MSESAILAGYGPTSGSSRNSEAGVLILAVLCVGFLITFVTGLISRNRSIAGAEDEALPSRSREWSWAWFVVFLLNLPIRLGFGFLVVSEKSVLGMLVGIAAVWLIGHVTVTRVREVRGALVVGGVFVGISQVMPIAHIVAGALAVGTVTTVNGQLKSATDAFSVTLLTAAMLAVAALAAGFVLRAMGWLLAGRSGTEW